MKTTPWNRIAGLPAAGAIAAVLASPALAQAAAHGHEVATPHRPSLNQGRMGHHDALRSGMARIRSLVDERLDQAHAGKLTPAPYGALVTRIETEIGAIVANCTLERKAAAMLHLLIADLGASTEVMAGKNGRQSPAQGLAQVAQAVNACVRHFDHPGLKPILVAH